MRRARVESPAWDYILDLAPDLALLQEVHSIPRAVLDRFGRFGLNATTKSGGRQRFETVILARETELQPFGLSTGETWLDEELQRFAGNLVACRVTLPGFVVNAVSVYSPAW